MADQTDPNYVDPGFVITALQARLGQATHDLIMAESFIAQQRQAIASKDEQIANLLREFDEAKATIEREFGDPLGEATWTGPNGEDPFPSKPVDALALDPSS